MLLLRTEEVSRVADAMIEAERFINARPGSASLPSSLLSPPKGFVLLSAAHRLVKRYVLVLCGLDALRALLDDHGMLGCCKASEAVRCADIYAYLHAMRETVRQQAALRCQS